jgi:hypothetical protein
LEGGDGWGRGAGVGGIKFLKHLKSVNFLIYSC